MKEKWNVMIMKILNDNDNDNDNETIMKMTSINEICEMMTNDINQWWIMAMILVMKVIMWNDIINERK